MNTDTALLIVRLAEVYAMLGGVFALPFAARWVNRLDSRAAEGTWGFRLSILPGSILFWPLLAIRVVGGRAAQPEEWTAHRAAASHRRRT